MTSQERVGRALQHKEPDRVPFDLGSTLVIGIMLPAYKRLLNHLEITKEEKASLAPGSQCRSILEQKSKRLRIQVELLREKATQALETC